MTSFRCAFSKPSFSIRDLLSRRDALQPRARHDRHVADVRPYWGRCSLRRWAKVPRCPNFLSHLFGLPQQCRRDTLPPRAWGDRHVADVRHFLPLLFHAAGQPLGRRVVAQCVHRGGADDLQCIEIGAQACEEGRNLEWMVNKAKGIEEECRRGCPPRQRRRCAVRQSLMPRPEVERVKA